jgi:hypothetical protein
MIHFHLQRFFSSYIFTLLMFRKLNKTTINKNKTTAFYRSTSFRFSFIFILLLSIGWLIVFVLREYMLKVHILVINYPRSEILVSCLYIYCSIAFLNKLLIYFFNKVYNQESYILIIEYSSVVTVAEWLDGRFESQSRFYKAKQWFDIRKSQNMYVTFLSL